MQLKAEPPVADTTVSLGSKVVSTVTAPVVLAAPMLPAVKVKIPVPPAVNNEELDWMPSVRVAPPPAAVIVVGSLAVAVAEPPPETEISFVTVDGALEATSTVIVMGG